MNTLNIIGLGIYFICLAYAFQSIMKGKPAFTFEFWICCVGTFLSVMLINK